MKRISLLTLALVLALMCAQAQTFPNVNWTHPLPAPAFGSAAAADVDEDGFLELIFTTYTADGKAHCLNAEDGSDLWTYDIGGCGDVATLIYDFNQDDTLDVFVNGSCNPTCFCINARTGRLLWSMPSGGGDSPPTVADMDADGKPEILFGNFSGQVRILNGEDGSLNRTVVLAPGIGPIQTEPTVGDLDGDGDLDFIVCNHFNNSGFYTWAYDYAANNTLWTDFYLDSMATYYAYHGGVLADVDNDTKLEYVIGDNAGAIRALNAEDGSLRWQVTGFTNVISALACANFDNDPALEIVYVNNDYINFNDHIGVLDGVTGGLDWSYPITFSAFRGVAISDINGNGKLDCVSGHYMGEVIAVEPFTGLLWNFDMDPFLPPGLPYWEVDHGPIIADFDQNGTMDVFTVAGYGTYTPDSQNVGVAISIEAGANASGCPEWRMFRQDERRTGYLSAQDIAENCTQVGVDVAVSAVAMASPNPAKDQVRILMDTHAGEVAHLMLMDLQGRKVLDLPSYHIGASVALDFAPGMYLWRLTIEEQIATGKFELLR